MILSRKSVLIFSRYFFHALLLDPRHQAKGQNVDRSNKKKERKGERSKKVGFDHDGVRTHNFLIDKMILELLGGSQS